MSLDRTTYENRQGERRGMVFSVFKHALRNAILPVVTYLGPLLAYTVTGSFIVEKIFTIRALVPNLSAPSQGVTIL